MELKNFRLEKVEKVFVVYFGSTFPLLRWKRLKKVKKNLLYINNGTKI
jgi:hypothetical protein